MGTPIIVYSARCLVKQQQQSGDKAALNSPTIDFEQVLHFVFDDKTPEGLTVALTLRCRTFIARDSLSVLVTASEKDNFSAFCAKTATRLQQKKAQQSLRMSLKRICALFCV